MTFIFKHFQVSCILYLLDLLITHFTKKFSCYNISYGWITETFLQVHLLRLPYLFNFRTLQYLSLSFTIVYNPFQFILPLFFNVKKLIVFTKESLTQLSVKSQYRLDRCTLELLTYFPFTDFYSHIFFSTFQKITLPFNSVKINVLQYLDSLKSNHKGFLIWHLS